MTEEKLSYEKYEDYNPERIEQLSYHYKEILRLIGENPNREGLLKTPNRVAKSVLFLNQGYNPD